MANLGEVPGPFCQSCGTPLTSAEEFGTREDGSRVNEYCKGCYREGRFTEPGVTLQQMTGRVAQQLAARRGWSEERARTFAMEWTPRLRRWSSLMIAHMSRNWGWILVRGILFVVFAILLVTRPRASLTALVLFFAAMAFVNGVTALAASVEAARARASWGGFLIEGIAGIVIAVVTFFYPGITLIALYSLAAAWAIVTGIAQLVTAIKLRKEIENEGWLAFSGGINILFGVLLVVLPAAGMLTLLWIASIYAFAFGLLQIAFAFRLRSLRKVVEEARPPRGIPVQRPAHV